jgi:hypothetical protein
MELFIIYDAIYNINNSDHKSAPIIASITVQILTGFVTLCSNAYNLSQRVSIATLSSGSKTRMKW